MLFLAKKKVHINWLGMSFVFLVENFLWAFRSQHFLGNQTEITCWGSVLCARLTSTWIAFWSHNIEILGNYGHNIHPRLELLHFKMWELKWLRTWKLMFGGIIFLFHLFYLYLISYQLVLAHFYHWLETEFACSISSLLELSRHVSTHSFHSHRCWFCFYWWESLWFFGENDQGISSSLQCNQWCQSLQPYALKFTW